MLRNLTFALCFCAVLVVPRAACGEPFAYVPISGTNRLHVIDIASGGLVAVVALPAEVWPYVAANAAGTRVYVACGYQLCTIDTRTNSVIATLQLRGHPGGLALSQDDEKVFVGQRFLMNGVMVVAAATNTPVGWLGSPLGATAGVALAARDSRTYVWAWDFESLTHGIASSDPRTYRYVGSVTVRWDEDVLAIAGNPVRDRFYYSSRGVGRVFAVRVVDTTSNSVVGQVPCPSPCVELAVDPAGARIYATLPNSNELLVVDAGTLAVVATVPVGIAPRGVAVDPMGDRVYVVNSLSNDISVVDASTFRVLATIPVGGAPAAQGHFIVARRPPPQQVPATGLLPLAAIVVFVAVSGAYAARHRRGDAAT